MTANPNSFLPQEIAESVFPDAVDQYATHDPYLDKYERLRDVYETQQGVLQE